MEECKIGRVKDWKSERLKGVGLGGCSIESVGLGGCRIESVGLEECRIGGF